MITTSAGTVPVETLVEATGEKVGAQAETAIAKALLTIQENAHKRAQETNRRMWTAVAVTLAVVLSAIGWSVSILLSALGSS